MHDLKQGLFQRICTQYALTKMQENSANAKRQQKIWCAREKTTCLHNLKTLTQMSETCCSFLAVRHQWTKALANWQMSVDVAKFRVVCQREGVGWGSRSAQVSGGGEKHFLDVRYARLSCLLQSLSQTAFNHSDMHRSTITLWPLIGKVGNNAHLAAARFSAGKTCILAFTWMLQQHSTSTAPAGQQSSLQKLLRWGLKSMTKSPNSPDTSLIGLDRKQAQSTKIPRHNIFDHLPKNCKL